MGEPDFSRMSPAAIARAQGLHPSRLPEPSVRPGAVTVLAWRAPKLPAPARRRPDQTPTADAPVDVERVLAAIRSASGLTHEELRARSRQRRLARWRHCAYALLRERCGLTLPEIGALLGRDHTGVLYGLRSWKARSAQPEYVAARRAIEDRLEG